jgi:uncharacterized protein
MITMMRECIVTVKKYPSRKRKAVLASTLILALAMPSLAQAAPQTGAVKSVSYIETAAAMAAHTLVPVKQLAETLGAQVKWDAAERTVTITRGETTAVITAGQSRATVNGKAVDSGTVVTIVEGRAYASLAFINETLGSHADWNAETRQVSFRQNDYEGRGGAFVYDLFRGNGTAAAGMMNEALSRALPAQALGIFGQQVAAAYGQPLERQTAEIREDGVHTNAVFVYKTKAGALQFTIRFDKSGAIDDFNLGPVSPVPTAAYQKPAYDNGQYTEQEVVIGDGDFALPGTLTVPEGDGPFPVVVLVHGSGLHDRDSSIGGVKIFKDLAAGLAAQNIAVLRYEKVTMAHTAKVSARQDFTLKEESADDAVRAVELLQDMDRIDPKRIYVAGHSQGGLATPIILENAPKDSIDGAILISAPSGSFTEVLVEQQQVGLERLKELGMPQEMIAAQEQAAAMWKGIVDMVEDPAYSKDNLPPNFPLQPSYWWFEQRDYSAGAAASEQNIPMLVLQGENDWQVSMAQYEGWKEALKDRTDVTYRSYPKVNHLLAEYEGLSIGMEYNDAANVSKAIIDDIAAWVNSQK